MAAAPFPELRSRGFVARYLTLFTGEAFSKVCVLVAFAYLARTLDPSEYGIVELALSITVFFVLGVESGMGSYGARVVAASPDQIPQLVPRVMLLRALLGIPAFAAILAVAWRYQSAGLGILAVNGVAILLTPFLTQWVFQGLRQMQWVASGTAIRNLVFVALVLALVRPGSDIRLVAVAEVAGIAALALFNTVVLQRRLHVRLAWQGLLSGTRRLLADVWALGLSDFTWACLWYSPAIIVGWLGGGRTEQVAWIGSAVRIVIALHTFVWLYFFNLLPNLASELLVSVESWRRLVQRSLRMSMWPAWLLAMGATLIAPVLIPAVYGPTYVAAVLPLQIVVWMIPVAWFSGHFRFSLIAAGRQRWEFAASAAAAVVVLSGSVLLGRDWASVGAASALLAGGLVNAGLALVASNRTIGPVHVAASVGPVLITGLICLLIGFGVTALANAIVGAIASCALFAVVSLRYNRELPLLWRGFIGR